MPFEFDLDQRKQVMRSRAWGELTDHELLGHLERVTVLFEQGVLDSAWGHVIDLTEVRSVDGVTSSCVQQMAEKNPWPRESKRVLIAPLDVEYGLGRMYQILGEPQTEGMFLARSAAEAEDWFRLARSDNDEAT